MAKKKATMTLKDFHGGSIPSDLPLPSAPGVAVRPSDRIGYDRQSSWGNTIGRSDHHRLRPGSAGGVRTFDDKSPFLSHSQHIGRNFDEDERKPLDGVSGQRRTVSDESIQAMPNRTVSNRTISTPVSQPSNHNVTNSYASRFTEANANANANQVVVGSKSAVNYQNVGATNKQANAWGPRKEVVTPPEPVGTGWSAPDTASKLAHASALEKVSSGRWHTAQQVHQTDVEVIKADSTSHKSANTRVGDADRALGGDKELVAAYGRATSPMYPGTYEKNQLIYGDGVQRPRAASKYSEPELQSPVSTESSERPKLKLLPRSKPLEGAEAHIDNKLGYQRQNDIDYMENGSESYGNANPAKHVIAESDGANQKVERPKLNLKPRSQSLEKLEGNVQRERNALFGGARPRELVLKERGIDDVEVNNTNDLVQPPPDRFKQDVPKPETVPKMENTPLDHRIGRSTTTNRRDDHVDVNRAPDPQRRNWRAENWRNNREMEKNHHHHHHQDQQPQQERPPSPDTWRKPIDQQRPSSGDSRRKLASAVELAQSFSKSVSDPKRAGIPNRGQLPFSRLMGPAPRPQINGY